MTTEACPLCRMELMREIRQNGDGEEVLCANCGPYRISRTVLTVFSAKEYSPSERAVISHTVRRSGPQVLVTTDFVDAVLAGTSLPVATDVLNNLLLYVASELGGPGEKINLPAINLRATIGAVSSTGVRWAFKQAMGLGLLEGILPDTSDDHVQLMDATLSIAGWERVDELMRAAKDSRKAFMAMKFGQPELDVVFREHFKLAVKQTGFTLQRLDEEPRAGLIDDRMRLEIRTSRFLIADLTHGNPGAYWEAGYAEGLGRPVIYTCRKDVFDNPKLRPHFDTNHHLTVVWDMTALPEAMAQLKAVVRVTLPAEAILEDDAD